MKPSIRHILALSLLLHSGHSMRAACEPEVLSPPTASAVRVRLVGVQDSCSLSYSSPKLPRDPCLSYPWFAAVYMGIPGVVSGVEARFVYSRIDECKEIVYAQSVIVLTIDQSYLDSHPGTIRISSKENLPFGAGAGYTLMTDPNAPALAFEGTVSRSNGVYVADVTFTGGTPAPDVAELVAAVEDSRLLQRQQRPLLATLHAAEASFAHGDCATGIQQLRAFQNKVRAQVSRLDADLADALIGAAQAIIDSACRD